MDTKFWQPEIGERYYYLDYVQEHFIVFHEDYLNDSYDRWVYRAGNMFKTKKLAEAAARRMAKCLKSCKKGGAK